MSSGSRASRSASPASDKADAVAACIDGNTRAVYCESVGNPAGNIVDLRGAWPRSRMRHGVPLIVDNTVATPILLKPIEHGADVVIHSATKFMGGHGTTMGGIIVDGGTFPVGRLSRQVRDADAARARLSRRHLHRALRPRRLSPRIAARCACAIPARCCRRFRRSCCCRASRRWRCASSATSRTRAGSPNSCATHPRVAWVSYAGFPDSPYYALAQKYLGGNAPSLLTFGVKGGFEAGRKIINALQPVQAPRQYGRRQVAGDASRLDHAPPIDARPNWRAPGSSRR